MNKNKYILIILTFILISILGTSFIFVSRINFYGEYQVSCKKNVCNISNQIFLECLTPTNRKINMPFKSEKIIISGFFKKIYFVFPCNCDSLVITVENSMSQKTHTPNIQCLNDKKVYEITTLNEGGFLYKLYAFVVWFLSIGFIKVFLFIVCFFLIFYLCYRIYKKTYLSYKKSSFNFIKQSFFLIVSFIFWIVILFVFLELGLRVFGSYYKTKQNSVFKEDKLFTVLCIGDSFTYGIGAKQGKSFPDRLEEIIEREKNIPVRVVNAGICAGNSFQILEQIQLLLNTYKPDVVVMLFGMANSWNYYGFSETDTFLNSFKTYKLISRIKENLKFKKSGFEMHQRVKEFSSALFNETWHSVIKNKNAFETAYFGGRYFLSLKKWQDAIKCFSFASSLQPINDTLRNALWVCTEKIDYDFYYNNYQLSDIQLTLMQETLQIIDSLINIYPQSVDLSIIKYRYFAVKGDTVSALRLLDSLLFKYSDYFVFYNDLETLISENDIEGFYSSENKFLKHNAFKTAKGYFYLKNNKPERAYTYFEEVLNDDKNDFMAALGINIINLKNNSDIIFRKGYQFFVLMGIQKALNEMIFDRNKILSENREISKYLSHFKNKILSGLNDKKIKSDSVYFYYSAILMTSLREIIHEDFFLYHYNKRSKSVKDADVLNWIERDINNITDICIKQGVKIISMNYPIIPPPNSEEASFWSVQSGLIWQEVSSRKNIPFVNQDSLFSLFGEQKSSLFEPRFTGTEHCNERGYELMAWHIYKCMLKNKMFEK